MSEFLQRSDYAFEKFILKSRGIEEEELKYLKVVLAHHSKVSSKLVTVAKVTGQCITEGFFCEQRIPWPCKCDYQFAERTIGDKFFMERSLFNIQMDLCTSMWN